MINKKVELMFAEDLPQTDDFTDVFCKRKKNRSFYKANTINEKKNVIIMYLEM